jgi:hypothetical protein
MNDLIKGVVHFLKEIRNIPKISKMRGASIGDDVDRVFLSSMKTHTNAQLISDHEWKNKYIKSFDMDKNSGCCSISTLIEKPLLVDKPFGSQNFPDFVLLYGHRGLPIEIKTSNAEKIVWNTGLPRSEGIYIFNGIPIKSSVEKVSTTFFMGSDVIIEEELKLLRLCRKYMQDCIISSNNELSIIGKDYNRIWQMYPRPMHDSNELIISNNYRNLRELKVIDYVNNFNWDKIITDVEFIGESMTISERMMINVDFVD